jgi:intracellular multiplication protein IcmE
MSDDIIKAGNSPNDVNDIDGADFDDAGGFDEDFGGVQQGRGLKDLMEGSPIVKVGIVAGVIITLIGAIILFGGDKEKEKVSRVGAGNTIEEAPGSENITQNYEEAVKDFNISEVERALKEQDSALPVPVGTTRGRVGLEAEAPVAEDPLERWRRIQEERQKRSNNARPKMPTVDPNAEAIDALSKAMATQMESILGAKKILGAELMPVTTESWLDDRLAALNPPPVADEDGDGKAEDADPQQIIIPAGEIEYAQLLIEANSDAEGPVLAQIASGPLSGSRVLGSFKVEDEYLVLSFNQIVIKGVSQSMDGIALDPATTGIGVVTDVDHRYFKRVILPAAAKFIEGMAGAIADTGTSVTVVGDSAVQEEEELDSTEQIYAGLEEAAGEVSDLLEEEADETEIQVKVRAGTPIGILFLAPVLEEQNPKAVLASGSSK